MGAYSTSIVLTKAKYSEVIKHVIFVDPADYHLDHTGNEISTWSGGDEYPPEYPTVSQELAKIDNPDLRVEVVNLTIRNCVDGKYVDSAERGKDFENGDPRLNDKMVKSFYSNTPKRNKGRYVELNHVPHAFMRDGDISGNVKKISRMLGELIANN
jgi:hypothetical protein